MKINPLKKWKKINFYKRKIPVAAISFIIAGYFLYLSVHYEYVVKDYFLTGVTSIGAGISFIVCLLAVMSITNFMEKNNPNLYKKINKIIDILSEKISYGIKVIILLLFGLVILLTILQVSPQLFFDPISVTSNEYVVVYNIVYVTLTAAGIILGFSLLSITQIIRIGPNIDKHQKRIFNRIFSATESFILVVVSGIVLLFFSSCGETKIFDLISTSGIKILALVILFIWLSAGFYQLWQAIREIRKTYGIEED